jgi:hypothetical protein
MDGGYGGDRAAESHPDYSSRDGGNKVPALES